MSNDAAPPSPAATARRVHAFRDDALGTSDTVDLLARLRAGEVSAPELVAAASARAQHVNGPLNAVVCWAPEPTAGSSSGALAGIPTFIKDDEELAGLPTRHGSRATSDRPAPQSSPVVDQLLQLGGVPLGKTTLPEFGLTCTTESSLTGATRNPWHLDRIVGGSSGGSAALVAAGAVPFAHGDDGGGSLRIPAACCGIVGLKPSRHRIIDAPEYDRLPVNIVAQGVLTRSVRDTALYLAEAERLHRDPRLEPVGHVTAPGKERLRIAVLLDGHSGHPPAASTAAAVKGVADLLSWQGHDVFEISAPWSRQVAVDFLRYWGFLAYSMRRWGGRLFGEPFRPDRTEALTGELARFFRTTATGLPASILRLRRFSHDYEAGFAAFDLILSPVLADEPPAIGYLGPDVPPRTQLPRILQLMFVSPMANISGAPAISLPLVVSPAGVPIGIQLAAPVGKERRLLEVALELEEARPFATLRDPAAGATAV